MTEQDFKGKVSVIDHTGRTLTMKDETGAPHIFKWTEPLDIVMNKWKSGYYLAVKYDGDTYLLKNATYWQEGKDIFPKQQSGGGRPYAPKNDKIITLQSSEKVAADIWMYCQTNELNFKEAMATITDAAIETAKRLNTEGGAQ